MKPTPTIEELKSLFDYEHDSGRLVWKIKRNSRGGKIAPGVDAGSLTRSGYLELKISGYRTYVHRVAWAMFYGMWPTGTIDHLDGDPLNNRASNLRHCTQSVNCENLRKPRRDNLLGVQGVSRKKNRYRSSIQVGGKRAYLGSFMTADEAHNAYLEAKRRLHEGCTI